MKQKPLGDDALLEPLGDVDTGFADKVLRSTPLWYYTLCEARSNAGQTGRRLGPVAGRIVAEVLVGLLEGDGNSYLSAEPTWTPELPVARDGSFTMADLVRFAQGGA